MDWITKSMKFEQEFSLDYKTMKFKEFGLDNRTFIVQAKGVEVPFLNKTNKQNLLQNPITQG